MIELKVLTGILELLGVLFKILNNTLSLEFLVVRQRLLYLLQYSRGSAKEAIKECAMLTPVVAYERAKKVLQDLFGRVHLVARVLLNIRLGN